MSEDKPQRRLKRPVLFICDIQEKFRKAIWEYEKVISTTQKLIRAATILQIPIVVTTQSSSKLGPTCTEISSLIPKSLLIAEVDKTAFSMWLPPVTSRLDSHPKEIVIVGIESHICVTQTALDAKRAGNNVYVLVDGVSSCNREEIGVAMDRLRGEGVVVTTSESWLYECLGDAGVEEFRGVAGLVKEFNGATKNTLETLLSKI